MYSYYLELVIVVDVIYSDEIKINGLVFWHTAKCSYLGKI